MKIKYLGTSAAEGLPAYFCQCKNCKRAKELGEQRTRSQSIIDGKLLIDFGPDTLHHYLLYKFDWSKISSVLITHSHPDHLCPAESEYLKRGYFNPDKNFHLTFYGGKSAMEQLAVHTKDIEYVDRKILSPYETVGIDGYTVTTLEGNHDPGANPLMYIISKDGKTLMYCHDTGYFYDETWDYLEKHPFHADFVSLDCNGGADSEQATRHMNIFDDIKIRQRLTDMGIADENTKFCLNHFSHNSSSSVPTDTDKVAFENGFLSSRDGLEFEF